MCSRIAQHSEIAEVVELFVPRRIYLLCYALLYVRPCGFYTVLVALSERLSILIVKDFVNMYIRFVVLVPLVEVFLDVLYRFCREVQSAFGRKLVENAHSLQGLRRVRGVFDHERCNVHRRCVISAVDGIVVKGNAHNGVVLRYSAAVYLGLVVCKRLFPAVDFDSTVSLFKRFLVGVCNVRELTQCRILSQRVGELSRCHAAIGYGGNMLARELAVQVFLWYLLRCSLLLFGKVCFLLLTYRVQGAVALALSLCYPALSHGFLSREVCGSCAHALRQVVAQPLINSRENVLKGFHFGVAFEFSVLTRILIAEYRKAVFRLGGSVVVCAAVLGLCKRLLCRTELFAYALDLAVLLLIVAYKAALVLVCGILRRSLCKLPLILPPQLVKSLRLAGKFL